MGDLDQICLVEERHLQLAIAGQFLNLSGTQGGDPFDAVSGGQVLADAGAGDHAAVADEHDLLQAEAEAQLIYLRGHGFGVAGVAGENFNGNRTSLGVGEESKNELRVTGFVVAGVAEFSQGTVPAFEVSRGQVVENHGPILELTFGQFPLNARLPFEQPVHGSVEFGVAGRIEAE